MSDKKVKPFDSFSEVYKMLIWVGFFKLLKKPKNRCISICHQIFRAIVFLLVVVNNLTHIIFIIQRRHDWDDVFEVTMVEIPHFKLAVKVIALNLNMSKIDKIHKLLNDPIFEARTEKEEEILFRNTKNMRRCIKFIKIASTLTGVIFWPASFFAKRYQDPTAIVAAYRPFATDTWATYSLSVLLEVMVVPWTGFGHLSLDCLVATYYAQAAVQLKIIKYKLEHLFDMEDRASSDINKDIVDKNRRRHFVHYIQRYEAVVWYTKTVGDIFNSSMSFEIISSGATICLVTYRNSSIPLLSASVLFLIFMLMLLLAEVFMYCYFGNMVQSESETVITSIYLSNWLSASPELRRLILVAMLRWSHGITPKVSSIIPLSVTTFVAVLRSAYSMFAVLSTKE